MKLRDTAEELFDMLGAPFTYWLALLIAYLAWQFLPLNIAFLVVAIALALLAVDEIREAREVGRG